MHVERREIWKAKVFRIVSDRSLVGRSHGCGVVLLRVGWVALWIRSAEGEGEDFSQWVVEWFLHTTQYDKVL